MSETFTVKPVDGGHIPDPETGLPLPQEGALVPRNVFWLRRVMDGSVTEVVDQPKAATKSKKED